MKKKLLSAMMAGMMVFGAGVQASATTTSKTYEASEADGIDATVSVTGTVRNSDGEAPAGRLEVELPTAMTFSVNQAGDLTGTEYQVKNKSAVGIKVSVAEFKTVSGNIKVKQENELNNREAVERNKVSLKLVGSRTVDLGGIVDTKPSTASEVLTVGANETSSISLTGTAGKKITDNDDVEENGATGNFTLLFKVEKND